MKPEDLKRELNKSNSLQQSENPLLELLKLVQELNDKYKIRHGIANVVIEGCYCDGCEKVRKYYDEFKRNGQ